MDSLRGIGTTGNDDDGLQEESFTREDRWCTFILVVFLVFIVVCMYIILFRITSTVVVKLGCFAFQWQDRKRGEPMKSRKTINSSDFFAVFDARRFGNDPRGEPVLNLGCGLPKI
jgi:hypothetical protein